MIQEHATSYINNKTLICSGTNINQIADILTNTLLLVPYYMKGVGFVSLGFYLQAKSIYKKHREELMALRVAPLTGHSLGTGNCCIVALLMIRDGFKGHVLISGQGGVKVLSKKAKRYLWHSDSSCIWKVNHKDIVPFLGWWHEPFHGTKRSGEKRKHIFDWDFKSHLNY